MTNQDKKSNTPNQHPVKDQVIKISGAVYKKLKSKAIDEQRTLRVVTERVLKNGIIAEDNMQSKAS